MMNLGSEKCLGKVQVVKVCCTHPDDLLFDDQLTSGLRVVTEGKRLKSRSAVHNS